MRLLTVYPIDDGRKRIYIPGKKVSNNPVHWFYSTHGGARVCTSEAAREDYDLKIPPPRYTWDDVVAKHNGGMRP